MEAAQRPQVTFYLCWYQRYAGNKSWLEEKGLVWAFVLCKDEQGCKPQERASLVLTGICSSHTELYLGQEVSAHFGGGYFLFRCWGLFCFGCCWWVVFLVCLGFCCCCWVFCFVFVFFFLFSFSVALHRSDCHSIRY